MVCQRYYYLLVLKSKNKDSKIVPKTSDLIKVYADKRLIFFSILALVQQGILMATCMSFTTQIAHEINASAFQIGLLSIVYIIVAVLASYFQQVILPDDWVHHFGYLLFYSF